MSGEILGIENTTEVSKVIEDFEDQGQKEQLQAVTETFNHPSLEEYGVVMRKPSLMFHVNLMRLMAVKESLPKELQGFVYVWFLAAPLETVYEVLEILEKNGMSHFMAKVETWWNATGIPNEITATLMAKVSNTFNLAAEMMPKSDENEGENPDNKIIVKKNPPLGPSWSVT